MSGAEALRETPHSPSLSRYASGHTQAIARGCRSSHRLIAPRTDPEGIPRSMTASRTTLLLAALIPGAAPALGHETFAAGEGEVWSVAWSPDGTKLVTTGSDSVIRIWDAVTLAPLAELTGHEGLVRGVAFTQDGGEILSAGFDRTLRVWDVPSGSQSTCIADSGAVFFPVPLPGGRAATASDATGARVWDLATGQLVTTLEGHTDRAWALAGSPDGTLLASGGREGTAVLWEAATGARLRSLGEPGGEVTCVAYSPDGALVALGRGNAKVELCDPATGKVVRPLIGHSGAAMQIAFSPDSRVVATMTGDGIVRLWEVATGYFVRALRAGAFSVAFSPDGMRLAAAGREGKVTLLDWQASVRALAEGISLAPKLIDMGLTPRGQGPRGTCSVFTTAGALEYAISVRTGATFVASVDYLNWAANRATGNPTDGQFFHNALAGFDKHGVCPESEMPYRAEFSDDYAPGEATLADGARALDLGLTVHWINPWVGDGKVSDAHIAEIRRVLASGYPVAAGSYHSVLLVGYVDDPLEAGGGAFLIRDSGGPGHWYEMPFEEARGRIGDVYWVE